MPYVYVLRNTEVPGVCKVGRTDRSPRRRAAEISQGTGQIGEWRAFKSFEVEDAVSAERAAHKILHRHRQNRGGREIFLISPKEAVARMLHGAEVFSLSLELQKRKREEQRKRDEHRTRVETKKAEIRSLEREISSLENLCEPKTADTKGIFIGVLIGYGIFGSWLMYAIGVAISRAVDNTGDAEIIFWTIVFGFFVVFCFFYSNEIKGVDKHNKNIPNVKNNIKEKIKQLRTLKYQLHHLENPENDGQRAVRFCPKCSEKLSLPANLFVKATCPSCSHQFFTDTGPA